MARPFGKYPAEWQRLPSTISLVRTAKKADMEKSLIGDNLIFTEKGGRVGGGGTWMHEDVALAFARSHNPEFAFTRSEKISQR